MSDIRLPFAAIALMALLGFQVNTEASTSANSPRCKYSVRDVAFVNVHGKSWQLELIKPASVTEAEFAEWNQILKAKLATTNLGFVWHDPNSIRAAALRAESEAVSDMQIFLTNSPDHVIPLSAKTVDFENRIESIVHSPVRDKLLNELTDSLCVFLLVKGKDKSKNELARQAIISAIEQTEKQMWMMEKASSAGPAIVEVNFDDAKENLTLRTAGIEELASEKLPALAIIFGQARRLGDVIVSNEIKKEKLVSLAALCGSDCECELDRDWLYGDQMVHDWTIEIERDTERELSFDPKSAFVIAEVAQILKKSNSSGRGGNFVDMGAGLVIHDLGDVEPEAVVNTDVKPKPAEPIEPDPTEDPPVQHVVTSKNSAFKFPLYLIAAMAVATIFTIAITRQKYS